MLRHRLFVTTFYCLEYYGGSVVCLCSIVVIVWLGCFLLFACDCFVCSCRLFCYLVVVLVFVYFGFAVSLGLLYALGDFVVLWLFARLDTWCLLV